MPMRIALYGKPHFATSDFYGSSMSGVLREGNPDRGRKIATWSLSRADVVAQLSAQGLSEIDYGWIDIKFRERSKPLEIGKKYFLVCERIADGKHFFGAFSFGENNPYAGGRHWLHPEHDLVFRIYIGNEEKATTETLEINATKTPVALPPAIPMPQNSADKKNVVPTVTPAQPPPNPVTPAPVQPFTPPMPPPPVAPNGPPQPRLRSVVPLEQETTEGIEGTNLLPLTPRLPKPNEANATRDSNKTNRRGLLPSLLRRK